MCKEPMGTTITIVWSKRRSFFSNSWHNKVTALIPEEVIMAFSSPSNEPRAS